MTEQFDFNKMRTEIKHALREVYCAAIEREKDNGIYAFVVRTVNDGQVATAACNTDVVVRSQYGLEVDEEPPADDDFEFPLLCHYRWNAEEWDPYLIDIGEGSLVLEHCYDDFGKCGFDIDFSTAAYAAIILALQDLDREGFFAEANERQKIVLYIANFDGPEWLPVESARRLNPAETASRFASEWALAMDEQPPPSGPEYEAFVQWMDRHAG